MVSDPIQRLKTYISANQNDIQWPEKLSEIPNLDYAVDRFGLARRSSEYIGPDEIVLLRQVIRWSGMTNIRVDRPINQPNDFDKWLNNAGVRWSSSGYLSADPFKSDWMKETSVIIDGRPQKRTINESFRGEPYLRQNLDFENWLSPAQKEATWTVLNARGGSTCMVVLPTGCGKSSCFWLLPTFTTGLTVVVVPTVALAIDQQQSALKRYINFPGINPCFFASDDNPDLTVAKIESKESRLIFTSPETCVSGRLRRVLDKFASSGWFRNLVIDEAHLVETWGAQFRVEFQILSSIRRKWLESSGNKLRTFLFSATMSPQCRKTLSEMFAEPNSGQEFVCQRLRPEISYYSCCFRDDNERWPYLSNAIWHLPRPAILYMTKPDDARDMFTALTKTEDDKGEGFQRIGCFTGETRRNERKRLLENWKNNQIDLMVANSAFGVGVDKADVRTVIHACYPENLDRYYQEVGRSGRDGYSSICLLLPTKNDPKIAKSLGTKLLRDEKKIQERWDAMYYEKEPIPGEEYIFKLPVKVKRLEHKGHRTYTKNIIWNKSLLLQLYRAKCIDFLNLELLKTEEHSGEYEEWVTVEVKFSPGTKDLAKLIKSSRKNEIDHFYNNFREVEELLTPKRCLSRTLKKLYGIANDQRVCGGCKFCRERHLMPMNCPRLIVLENHADSPEISYNGTIVENWPDPSHTTQQDDFIDMIEECFKKYSLRPLQIYCPEKYFIEILNLLDGVLKHYPHPYRIDPFTENTTVRSFVNKSPLFFHIGSYSDAMFEKAQVHQPIHCFCDVRNPFEPNGRPIKIKYKCITRPSPEAWLKQLS